MNDLKVVIDAGHGGTDPGAVANRVNEKDLNLMIAKYMLERFKEAGIDATLIRTTDETLSPTERVRRILAAYGDDPNVVVISNHINSSPTPGAEGSEVIYALRNTAELSENILNQLERAGLPIRNAYQRRLPSNPSKDYYFIHRDTGSTQPIIMEYGYINNPTDLKRIQENYRKYVNAVVEGVLETFNIPSNIPQNMSNKYTVKAGDTLWNIAKRHGTTVENLMRLNNLTTDAIMIGQKLALPNTNVHTVVAGDTLWNIARRNNTTVENLMKINNLTSDLITIGQVIRLS